MNTLKTLVTAMVQAEDPMPAEMQRRAYRYLTKVKANRELGLLAARADLVDDLDALMRERKELDILVGWSRRPGRTTEELTARLLKEKRVGALMPLATMTDLPAAIYDEIAKVKSVKLTEALICNAGAPVELRYTKLKDWAVTVEAQYPGNLFYHLRSLDLRDRDLLRRLVEDLGTLSAVQVALSMDLVEGPNVERFLDIVLEAIDTYRKSAAGMDERSREQTQSQIEQCLVDLSVFSFTQDRSTRACAWLKKRMGTIGQWVYMRNRIQEAITRFENADPRFQDDLEAFAAEIDPARCGERFANLISRCTDDTRRDFVLDRAAPHRHLPSAVMLPVLDDLNGNQSEIIALEWERRGDFEALAALTAQAYWYPHWMSSLRDEETFVLSLLKSRSPDGEVPAWLLAHPVVAARGAEVYLQIPVKQLARCVKEMPHVLTGLQDVLVTALGSDDALWESFESIVDEYDGDMTELLGTVTAL